MLASMALFTPPNPALVRTVRLRRPAAQLSRWASRRNREPFVECTDVRWIESSFECKRRIRLRHVAAGSDLGAIWVHMN